MITCPASSRNSLIHEIGLWLLQVDEIFRSCLSRKLVLVRTPPCHTSRSLKEYSNLMFLLAFVNIIDEPHRRVVNTIQNNTHTRLSPLLILA